MASKKISTLLIFTAFLLNTAHAQFKVFSNNKVQIGPLWWTTPPNEQLFLNGGTYINCYPAAAGLSIINYNVSLSGTTYNDPSIMPQFGNSAWLGAPTKQFYRTYSNQFYANQVLITSDENLKSNITRIESDSAINKILNLKAYTYDLNIVLTDSLGDYRNDFIKNENKNQIGLMAQDLLQVVPQAVKLDEKTNIYSVNYIMLIPLLIESIKQQQQKINSLQQQIDALKR
ncbi:MAG: tail fiber domain-containing protein [Bacteroidetes bacterium]|nr:tail fiber domain-containing protein [Bacteroidota bacterium]